MCDCTHTHTHTPTETGRPTFRSRWTVYPTVIVAVVAGVSLIQRHQGFSVKAMCAAGTHHKSLRDRKAN